MRGKTRKLVPVVNVTVFPDKIRALKEKKLQKSEIISSSYSSPQNVCNSSNDAFVRHLGVRYTSQCQNKSQTKL